MTSSFEKVARPDVEMNPPVPMSLHPLERHGHSHRQIFAQSAEAHKSTNPQTSLAPTKVGLDASYGVLDPTSQWLIIPSRHLMSLFPTWQVQQVCSITPPRTAHLRTGQVRAASTGKSNFDDSKPRQCTSSTFATMLLSARTYSLRKLIARTWHILN